MGCTQAKPNHPIGSRKNYQDSQKKLDQPQINKAKELKPADQSSMKELKPADQRSMKELKPADQRSMKELKPANQRSNKEVSQADQIQQEQQNSKTVNNSKTSIKINDGKNEIKKPKHRSVEQSLEQQRKQKDIHKNRTSQAQLSKQSNSKNNKNKFFMGQDRKMDESHHNPNLQKSKDSSRKKQKMQDIEQEVQLGVQSRIQKKQMKQKVNQKNQKAAQRVNGTMHHPEKVYTQKNKAQNGVSVSLANQLFYTQHRIGNANNYFQKQVFQSQNNLKETGVLRQNKSQISQLDGNLMNKSMKSQIIYHNNLQDGTNHTNQNDKNKYFSVYQHKRGYQDRSKGQKMKARDSKQIKQDQLQDYYVEQIDQQGAIKVPIQISYHANSKRIIQFSSREQISQKASDKYLKGPQTQAIFQTKYAQKSEDQDIMGGLNQSRSKKESRLKTACFMNSLSKHQQSERQDSTSEEKFKEITFKKKLAPIKYQEISFERDSDCIPDEQNHACDLQMSVHLNLTQNC